MEKKELKTLKDMHPIASTAFGGKLYHEHELKSAGRAWMNHFKFQTEIKEFCRYFFDLDSNSQDIKDSGKEC